jgi:4-diphosphocytidyl-2-C-methyl-D-erythritol kinase
MDWVLVFADYGLSTPDVFHTLDGLRDSEGVEVPEPVDVDPTILQALRHGDPETLSRVLINDLQRASIALAPQLRDIIGLGEARGALAGMVSGSGPTIALLARDSVAASVLAEELTHRGHTALAVHGPVPGARIISDTLL